MSVCFLVFLSAVLFGTPVSLVLEAEWGLLPEGFTGGGWTRVVVVLVGVLTRPGDFLGDFVAPSILAEVAGLEVTFGVLALASGVLRGAEAVCVSECERAYASVCFEGNGQQQ